MANDKKPAESIFEKGITVAHGSAMSEEDAQELADAVSAMFGGKEPVKIVKLPDVPEPKK